MSTKEISTGYQSGNLTVLEEAPRKNGRRYWLCRCDCGNTCTVLDSHLKSGHTRSCGCLSRRYPDCVPGMKFGQLTLIEKVPHKSGRRHWKCRCDCGSECTVSEIHLKTGHTGSCGCMLKQRMKYAGVDLSGKRFGRLTVIGLAPERKNNAVTWRCVCDCGNELVSEADFLLRGKTRSCGCLQEEQRKINMQKAIHFVDGTCIEKIACQRENAANTSGHRGVIRRPNGSWRVEITFRKKRYYLGTYKTFEEAVQARLKGEEMYAEYLEEYYANKNGEVDS